MKKCLYVGNLPRECAEETVRDLFAAGGRVVDSVTIAIDRRTGRSRGFGFVEMGTEEDAALALEAIQGAEIDGRPIKVGAAYRDKDLPVRPGGYDDYGASDPRRFKGGRGRGRR